MFDLIRDPKGMECPNTLSNYTHSLLYAPNYTGYIHCHEVAFLALVGVASYKVQEAGRGKGAHLQ